MKLEVSPWSKVITKKLKSWEPGTLVSRLLDGQRQFYVIGEINSPRQALFFKFAVNLQTGLCVSHDDTEFEECQGKVNIVAEWNE